MSKIDDEARWRQEETRRLREEERRQQERLREERQRRHDLDDRANRPQDDEPPKNINLKKRR